MPGDIAMKLLVKVLSLQQMGGGTGGGHGTFALPPHGGNIVSTGKDWRYHIPNKFATPSWCSTLLEISRSEFVVTLVWLDQLTKLYTTPGGEWDHQTMGWGDSGYEEGRTVLVSTCISLGTSVGSESRNPPPDSSGCVVLAIQSRGEGH